MSHRIRLAFVIPTLGKGGAEKVLVNFVNHINPAEYEVYIFCLKKKGELLPLVRENIHVIDIDAPRAYFSIFALRKAIKKYKPEVLIGWLGHVNAILSFFKPLLPGKLVLLCRESSIPSLFISHYRLPFLFRFFYGFYNRFDGIICQSEAMKDDLVNNFNVASSKIRIIFNPVVPSVATDPRVSLEASVFLQKRQKFLLFVGRFSEEKRVHLIINCMEHLPIDYKLILIGYGGKENELRSLIREKNLNDRILIVNDCSDPTPYYKLSDCLLLSSSFEGFPNVLLEANLHGCPVVVYQTQGGAREIVHPSNGIYIEDGRGIETFAKSIIEVCTSGRFNRQQISQRTSNEFDIERKTEEYLSFVKGFLNRSTTSDHRPIMDHQQ